MRQTKAFVPADILIPREEYASHWSVVACDQYTSEPEYWNQVEQEVGQSPSAYRMILPEVYLERPDVDRRIREINRTMEEYCAGGVFRELANSMLYLRRTLWNGTVRQGLVGAVDLEEYDYKKGSQSLIRATEGTVLERIPPRMRVRENACLESPHIMLLIDDPDGTVIEPLEADALSGELPSVYRFPLMKQGGTAAGYSLGEARQRQVLDALNRLADPHIFQNRYPGAQGRGGLLFAVGDGNHSLATAKACYEALKQTLSPEEAARHPARYALVEVVNIHDASLEFEPIHRVVFGVDPQGLERALREYYQLSDAPASGQEVTLLWSGQEKKVWITNPKSNLAVGSVQAFLDEYLPAAGGRVDYIHGEDVVRALSAQPGNVGFLLPPMEKSQLFPTVILDGALPRKTFSMGHAWDKRYYLECRKIR